MEAIFLLVAEAKALAPLVTGNIQTNLKTINKTTES